MRTRRLMCLTALWLCSAAANSLAASHKDWTPIPLGSFPLHEGEQTLHIARPYDRFGVVDSPITLTALVIPTSAPARPAQISFATTQGALPRWTVGHAGQVYVIGLAAVQQISDAESDKQVTLQVTVTGALPGLTLMASGASDLALADPGVAGPLEGVIRLLEPGVAREYLKALADVSAGRPQMAEAALQRLTRGSDDNVARFARATLRQMYFAQAEAVAGPDFAAQYRLGLYAQQCGMFRAARLHFRTALESLQPGRPQPNAWYVGDAWYRLGEMMDRCGEPPEEVAAVMERAGTAANVYPNTWDVCVAILKSKEYEEERDGAKVRTRIDMTPEQIERIKREWYWVAQTVYGASGGHLRLETRYIEIPDESSVPYGVTGGWLFGPTDAFVPVRGSVDCVMSFHPRGPSVTGGADCGPNGAAMTDIGTWCGWEVYLHEWNHQFDWTVRTDEVGVGYPITHHSDSCGHQPIPSMGYGHRASMRYYVTPAMYHRAEPADPDTGAGYIHDWQISAPLAIEDPAPAEGLPPHHALLYPPPMPPGTPTWRIAATTDFIDLKTIFADQGVTVPPWYITRASARVYSPRHQEVRLWLGHNDGLALWVNDDLVHRGDYYAIAKFEDQNWPNMVATSAVLQKGWNRVWVAVESWPPPRDHGYGFSVRICDFENRPVEGLRVADAQTGVPTAIPHDPLRPTAGKYYRWDDVRDDFHQRLPQLNGQLMAEYAGLPNTFDVVASIGPTHGYVAMGVPGENATDIRGGIPLRALPARWDRQQDADTRLNNLMDWNREAVAVYPFAASQPQRHYLLMRPEAVGAYLTCLREAPAAPEAHRNRSVSDRILGWVRIGREQGEAEGVRVLIIAEVCLPSPLPIDEEDLLMPVPR